MPEIKLNSPLQYIKGVGPRKAAVLARYGMETVADLLHYFPRQYLDRTNVVPIGQLKVNEEATIIGEVKAHGLLHGTRRRYEVILGDDTGAISLLWFGGIRYWERFFKKGDRFAATGLVSYFMGYQIIHPDLERLDSDSDRMVHAGRIIPVYPQTAELSKVGLGSKSIRKLTSSIIEQLGEKFEEHLPKALLKKTGLMDLNSAVIKSHFPEDRHEVEACRRRHAFDELLELQFMVYSNKASKAAIVKEHRYQPPGEKMTTLREHLPFELTSAQKKVVKEIIESMQAEQPMSRLLHGDVGCGKTVVAFLAALYAAENGYQASFMAPTEILAEQHFRNWEQPQAEVGIKTALLTSSLKAVEKKAIAEACAEGEIDILIGTHALIYEYVLFKKLTLVIIDEQHRFGVEQRGKLYAKGDHPDLLVMTATPIPRTLTLTLYGDLDISTIESLPPGRKPVRTVWRGHDSAENVFKYVAEEAQKGKQAYIVYPLIEKSVQLDLNNVEDAYAELTGSIFKNLPVAMVHGRVKADERDRILEAFREGDIKILMSTTVIEVGLDNPNANLMVIEHAERFGLAQLHQLRGRIGRGGEAATLIAIAHTPLNDTAKKRLNYFVSENDGFKIAEADLELRGPGEVFGTRQSGMPDFKAFDFWKDRQLLETSREVIEYILMKDNSLDKDFRRLYNYLKTKTARKELHLGGG